VVTRRVGLIRRAGRTLAPAARQLYDFLAASPLPEVKARATRRS